MPNMSDEREIIDGILRDAEAALARGAAGKASILYRGVLSQHPGHSGALRQLAAIEINGGDPAKALEFFEQARQSNPLDADLCHGIATALRLMGRTKDAELALKAALKIDPNHGPALYDTAMFLQQAKKHKAASEIFLRLAAQGSGGSVAMFNRGVGLFHLGSYLAAERWFHAAANMDPKAYKPFINLAMIYRIWGFVKEAVACLEHAADLAPEDAEVHWNLANALLVSGDFARGFAEYEWRFRRAGRGARPVSLPAWKGEALDGKTILITLEQGMGDAVHFVRFVKDVAARGGCVVMEVHPGLEGLLATAPGVAAVVPPGTVVRDAVCSAPLMSLPHLLGTTFETIPAAVPYLTVPAGTPVPPQIAAGRGLRVGLVWRGNPKHEQDKWRSVPLAILQPLLDVPDVSFYSLQLGGTGECAAGPWAERVIDLAPVLGDFTATAAAVAALDLVISVDTAVAHVAGALGKPVWVLIAQGNDWRWFHDRADSPWYPTLRLFRQRRERKWGPAVTAMKKALAELARTAESRQNA